MGLPAAEPQPAPLIDLSDLPDLIDIDNGNLNVVDNAISNASPHNPDEISAPMVSYDIVCVLDGNFRLNARN